MADPTFGELGTLQYTGGTGASSLSSTIANVAVGDLLAVVVQRNSQTGITGVASSSPALTFTLAEECDAASSAFLTQLWLAIATQSAASMTITASYSASAAWGGMFSVRYSSGVDSITPNASTGHAALQSSTTNRTNANIVTTVRTLLLVFGTDWNDYQNGTAAANWTKRVDSDTFGANSTTQFFYDRIADAGTYPSGNYATSGNDQYMSGIAALPVIVDSSTGQPTTLRHWGVPGMKRF